MYFCKVRVRVYNKMASLWVDHSRNFSYADNYPPNIHIDSHVPLLLPSYAFISLSSIHITSQKHYHPFQPSSPLSIQFQSQKALILTLFDGIVRCLIFRNINQLSM